MRSSTSGGSEIWLVGGECLVFWAGEGIQEPACGLPRNASSLFCFGDTRRARPEGAVAADGEPGSHAPSCFAKNAATLGARGIPKRERQQDHGAKREAAFKAVAIKGARECWVFVATVGRRPLSAEKRSRRGQLFQHSPIVLHTV